MSTRVRRTKLRVDPLAVNEAQAVLRFAPLNQTGAVVRYVLVGSDALSAYEETAGAFHPRASKRDRLTRSPGLLAAVLAVVVTALSVVLVARRRHTLRGSRVVGSVTAIMSGRAEVNVVSVALSLSIHLLMPAVVDVVLLVVVCSQVVVDHLRHLRTRSHLLWSVWLIETHRSLLIAICVSLAAKV